MAIAETCPTCHRTDVQYDHPAAKECAHPWHADAHLRRKARIEAAGINPRARAQQTLEIGPDTLRKAADVHNASTIRMRAEHARACFEKDLAVFVQRWAPVDPWERDNFQRALMMLMRDAMEHKSMTYGLHIERIEATLDALSMVASSSVQAIFRRPSDDQATAMEEIRRQMAAQPKKEGD